MELGVIGAPGAAATPTARQVGQEHVIIQDPSGLDFLVLLEMILVKLYVTGTKSIPRILVLCVNITGQVVPQKTVN